MNVFSNLVLKICRAYNDITLDKFLQSFGENLEKFS